MLKPFITSAVAAFALLGCDRPDVVQGDGDKYTHVIVHYRNFDYLAPISYTKDDLISWAPIKLIIDSHDDINNLNNIIPDRCRKFEKISDSEIDYYLNIKFFDGSQLKKEFSSSNVLYTLDSATPEEACQLSKHDRQRMADWIEGISGSRNPQSN